MTDVLRERTLWRNFELVIVVTGDPGGWKAGEVELEQSLRAED
jgi:hypothetical protein